MIPVNNSDLAWLVIADYNQDNNIGFPDELREDVYNPEVDQSTWESPRTNHIGGYSHIQVGGSIGGLDVGGSDEEEVGGVSHGEDVLRLHGSLVGGVVYAG